MAESVVYICTSQSEPIIFSGSGFEPTAYHSFLYSYWWRKTSFRKFQTLKFSKCSLRFMETCIIHLASLVVMIIVFRETLYHCRYKQINLNNIATLQHSIKMIYGSIYYESFHRSLLDDAIQYPVSSDVGLNSQWIVGTHFSLCPELITLATMSGNGWRLLYCAKWGDCWPIIVWRKNDCNNKLMGWSHHT